MNTILFTVAVLTLTGLCAALILYFTSRKFFVEEDSRIDGVQDMLPGANCGGCGAAGCRAFAEQLVGADSMEGLRCPVGGDEVMNKIAAYLGREVQAGVPQVAVVSCNGTCENRPARLHYDGANRCAIAHALFVGAGGCAYGCLGCGDCVAACQFGALSMDAGTGLPVVDASRCTACGACVKACPRGIVELRRKFPGNRQIYVSCVSHDKGAVARKICAAACIGCGKCQKTCTFEAITLENNVAWIDSTKCRLCRKCAETCPTHSIVERNFPARRPVPEAKPAAAATVGSSNQS